MKTTRYSSKRPLSSRSFGRCSEFVSSATLIIIFKSVPIWLIIFIGRQKSSALVFFHSLCSDIFRRYVAGFIFTNLAHSHTRSHCSCVKRTCLRFVRFVKITLLIYLSNIGVLGAAAPNKPTAEPVGKKVYFFCTCDNQANPLCKHNSNNAFTSFQTGLLQPSEQCRY